MLVLVEVTWLFDRILGLDREVLQETAARMSRGFIWLSVIFCYFFACMLFFGYVMLQYISTCTKNVYLRGP